jgi:Condensation domain
MSELYPQRPGHARNLVVHSRIVHGPVDLRAMERAFADIMRRHDSLRLILESTGVDPRLRIETNIEPPVEFLDLSGVGESEQQSFIRELVFCERRRTFDLRSGPAWHAWFIRLGRTRHFLNVCFSHLVADGWSSKVFVRDLMVAYRARADGWPSARDDAPSFAELCALQARRREPTAERLRYWRERLTPLPERWPFTSEPQPHADLLARSSVDFALPHETAQRMKVVAWRARTTPYVVMLAGYHLVLSLRTGKPRTTIHIVTRDRRTEAEQNAIFLCAGYLYVSTETPLEATLRDVVRETRESMQEASENLVPYKDLARAVNPGFEIGRPWSDAHVFDGDFTSWAYDEPAAEIAGVHLEETPVPEARPPDYGSESGSGDLRDGLTRPWEFTCGPNLDISTYRDGGAVGFNPEIYPTEDMQRLADEYVWVMEKLVWRQDTRVESLREDHARRFGS